MSNIINFFFNVFEMCTWRRMQKVSWTERKTNEEVLETISEERFIHSDYFHSAFSGPLLLRGAIDTARILCRCPVILYPP